VFSVKVAVGQSRPASSSAALFSPAPALVFAAWWWYNKNIFSREDNGMALTKEDLQAIEQVFDKKMDEKLGPINTRLDTMDARQDTMNTRLDTMRDSIDTLKQDMAHHNHYVEPLLKTVSDGIIDLQRNYARFDKLDAEVEDHDNRIFALEQAVKK
jgi:uncharacterized protein YdcH (DUF465 family)